MDLGGWLILIGFFVVCYVFSDVGEAIFNRKKKEHKEETKEDIELQECDICGEMFEELIDTEGMLNGGIGKVCEQCKEDGDIR